MALAGQKSGAAFSVEYPAQPDSLFLRPRRSGSAWHGIYLLFIVIPVIKAKIAMMPKTIIDPKSSGIVYLLSWYSFGNSSIQSAEIL